jgi:hypothetical protein
VNIATDLELVALGALGRDTHLTDAEMNALPETALRPAQLAVEQVVRDKMLHFVKSAGKSPTFSIEKG